MYSDRGHWKSMGELLHNAITPTLFKWTLRKGIQSTYITTMAASRLITNQSIKSPLTGCSNDSIAVCTDFLCAFTE